MVTHTRDRLLDVAEELIAQQGFAATSIREITGAAEANVAAVHYHFGDKEGLLRAIVQRRGEPLNRERLRLLAEAEAISGGTPPPLDVTLRAFIAPVFRMREETPQFPALLSRVLIENLMPVVGEVFRSTFYECLLRFRQAISRALPELPPEEIRWRLLFTVGVFQFICCGEESIRTLAGDEEGFDIETMTERVVGFCEAGMRALVPETRGGRA